MRSSPLLVFLLIAALMSTGCSYLVTTPVVVSESQEFRRHQLLEQIAFTEKSQDPLAPRQQIDEAGVIFVEPFVVAYNNRKYFTDLWAVPLIPYIDSYYGMLQPPPETFGGDLIQVPVRLPPLPPDGIDVAGEQYFEATLQALKEGLEKVPVRPESTEAYRKNLVKQAGTPLEEYLASRLQKRIPDATVYTSIQHAGITQRWVLRESFQRDAMREYLVPLIQQKGDIQDIIFYLNQEDQVRLETVREKPDLRGDAIRVGGTVQRFDLENRRILYCLTFIGANFLSILGLPSSNSGYGMEMELWARDMDGSVLARRTVQLRTERETGGLYYGYEPLKSQVQVRFMESLDREVNAFADEVRGAHQARSTMNAQPVTASTGMKSKGEL